MRVRGAIVGLIAGVLSGSATAAAAPEWPPADQASIRPGVQLFTDGGQCTANFVFYDAADIYIGYAAHCARGESDSMAFDPATYCRIPSLPIGTPIEITGASQPGRLAYSSWRAMIDAEEEEIGPCNSNDFALVRIDPADHGRVNPTVPVWGGPTGLRQSPVREGEKALSYGHSGLRQGLDELNPREGYEAQTWDDGWGHWIYFVTPGIFGDSGSGVMDAAGNAMAVLTTLNTLMPGSNGAGDLARKLAYMRDHGGPDVRLALTTEPFTGPQLGPGAVPPPPPEPQPGSEPERPAPAPPAPPAPPAQGSEPPPAPPARSSPSRSKPRKKKARRRARSRRTRCRTRGANRRAARGRRAPKCSKGKRRGSTRRARARARR